MESQIIDQIIDVLQDKTTGDQLDLIMEKVNNFYDQGQYPCIHARTIEEGQQILSMSPSQIIDLMVGMSPRDPNDPVINNHKLYVRVAEETGYMIVFRLSHQ